MLLWYCIISSIVIGCWTVYTAYQNDKDEVNWIPSLKAGKYVKVLSKDSPTNVKLALVVAFVPFINTLWLIVLIWDLFSMGNKK